MNKVRLVTAFLLLAVIGSAGLALSLRVEAAPAALDGPAALRAPANLGSPRPWGTVIYVKHNARGKDDGSSWADAYTDLQDGLAAAETGDQIWVARGVYYPGPPGKARTATFELPDGVALYGGFTGKEKQGNKRNWTTNVTVLSGDLDRNDTTDENGVVTDPLDQIVGQNAYHVVTAEGVGDATVLDGFTVTAGLASGTGDRASGGGMANHDSNPTLANLIFSGNRATLGGGMANDSSDPALSDVTFTSNVSLDHGAGMFNQGAHPTLTNVTFSGNQAINYGGGMYNYSSHPTLTSVTFNDNEGWAGGGMYNEYSDPILTHVTFLGNDASTEGGGMRNFQSRPTLANVTFTDNDAALRGGGMFSKQSNPRLTNVTFSGNRAAVSGGGMYSSDGSATVTNVAFKGNEAEDGGGLSIWEDRSHALTNVIFSGNDAEETGGGIWNRNSSPTLTNVTFAGNHAELEGGGIYNEGGSPNLVNSIVWGNWAPAGPQIHSGGASTPSVMYSDVEGGYVGTHVIDVDPLFVDPGFPAAAPTAAGDYRLSQGSPAVDAGTNAAVFADTDLDGDPRVVDGNGNGSAVVDMGAYELQVTVVGIYLPVVVGGE